MSIKSNPQLTFVTLLAPLTNAATQTAAADKLSCFTQKSDWRSSSRTPADMVTGAWYGRRNRIAVTPQGIGEVRDSLAHAVETFPRRITMLV